jgi:hypothetical protein
MGPDGTLSVSARAQRGWGDRESQIVKRAALRVPDSRIPCAFFSEPDGPRVQVERCLAVLVKASNPGPG